MRGVQSYALLDFKDSPIANQMAPLIETDGAPKGKPVPIWFGEEQTQLHQVLSIEFKYCLAVQAFDRARRVFATSIDLWMMA
jgi:hypothetical protein